MPASTAKATFVETRLPGLICKLSRDSLELGLNFRLQEENMMAGPTAT